MAYTLKTKLARRENYGGSRSTSKIKYIVIHYTANDGDSDEANANYFATKVVKASAHYFVDDDSVTQSVLDGYVAYSVGGSKWADCAKTGGGKFYKTVCNTNSISIEMCDTKKDGTYAVSDKTLENVVELTKVLMKKYNIDIDHVVRHFDVNGKHCPVYFMDQKAWDNFKSRVANKVVTSVTNQQNVAQNSATYTQADFLNDCKKALGLSASATASQVLAKTVTISKTTNKNHPLVTPLERLMKSYGYYSGSIEADNGKKPCFGAGMEKAIMKYQTYVIKHTNVKNIDGVVTAKAKTWKVALGLK